MRTACGSSCIGGLAGSCCCELTAERPRSSRRNPQHAREALEASLPGAGLSYDAGLHKRLGGLRKPAASAGDANAAWRLPSFRGYADYMQTPEFQDALAELLEQAARLRTAVLCAEALPWRCHRGLIADAAMARGWAVHDIFISANGTPSIREHKSALLPDAKTVVACADAAAAAVTSFAVVGDGGRVSYPAEAAAAAAPSTPKPKQSRKKGDAGDASPKRAAPVTRAAARRAAGPS